MPPESSEKSRQKSTQFWRQVSKGLRTPLNVIKGTADIAENQIYDIDIVRDGFHKIGESSEFLLNVVNDIVDFVTIENDELEINEYPFNLNALITQFIAKYFNKAQSQKKHLDAQNHAVLHEHFIGDEHRMEQILDCMLYNSLKYSSERDNLKFEIFETGATGNKVSLRFIMTVSNRKMYDHLTGTVNDKVVTEATDLALYNSHYILLKMGGTIKIVLDENEYSKIIIDMTFGVDESEVKEASLFQNEKLLIICDDRAEAEARGELLTELKASYNTAVDFEEALEMIGAAEEAGHPYSGCIVDWNVENFVVQDFVNDVHNIFGSSVPLIAMAYNVDSVCDQALRIGFDAVMNHTWFRSTVCDVLVKNAQGVWKNGDVEDQNFKYDFRNKHILVAEDSPLNMEFVVHILTSVQADVICTTNGIEAYNMFKQKPEHYFDCILMDVNMPEMDGYEATRNIRKSQRGDACTVPIFALTANAFQADIKDALEAGMDGHFSKPIDVYRMYATLDELFRKNEGETEKAQVETEKRLDEFIVSDHEKIDELTGQLSLYGLEHEVSSHRFLNHPVGFMLVEIKDYEQVLEDHGRETVDKLLCRLSEMLEVEFRKSDLIARYSESCFAVVLNYCDNGITFVENKIRNINKLISGAVAGALHNTAVDAAAGGIRNAGAGALSGAPQVSGVDAAASGNLISAEVCCGAAYSDNGYSHRLANLAFEALSEAKHSDFSYYDIIDKESFLASINPTDLLNKTIFGTDMFLLRGNQIADIEHIDELMSALLSKNQAVGIMCGTFEEGLPICSASGFALDNLGYDPESFINDTESLLMNAVCTEDREALKAVDFGIEPDVITLRMKHKCGSLLWFRMAYISTVTRKGEKMWIASFRPDDEKVVGNLCISDFASVSVILPEENTIVFEKGVETVYTDNLKLRKRYNYESLLNSVFVKMHREEVRDEFMHNMSLGNVLMQLEQKGIYEFVAYKTLADGSLIPVRYKYRYMDDSRKTILFTHENMLNLAESDDVTSLLNENGFYRSARVVLDKEENTDKNYAILYTNIKDFKTINETMGYANANELLRKSADYAEKSVFTPVCAARFHADKFCYLIERENLDYDELSELCYRKVTLNGNTINMRNNCGIYEIDDRGQDVAVMCDKAILAAECITNEYAKPYYVFDASVDKRYQNRIFVLNNLERAFERDEFCVYYQPVCDVKTGRICSAEALIRWIMPGGKVVSPGVFIPVLESKGYISKLDLLVANKVQEFTESRVNRGSHVVPVSINLSRMDFLNDAFLENLQRQIDGIQIDKSFFRYEVTESAYINIGEGGVNLVDEIRKNKSQIYIDDFGTGYSSLQNLMEVQFDVLKLDMYFIRRIGTNPIAEGIIDAAIHLCHGLGRKVIAEGVETDEQFNFLAERDCDYIQGYYFYKPMPGEEFAKLLDAEQDQ